MKRWLFLLMKKICVLRIIGNPSVHFVDKIQKF